jgi:hypothetical protein
MSSIIWVTAPQYQRSSSGLFRIIVISMAVRQKPVRIWPAVCTIEILAWFMTQIFGSGPNFVGPVFCGVLVPRPAQNSRDISVIKRGDTHGLRIPPCPRPTIENDARMIVSYSVGRMTDQRDLCYITVGYTTRNIHAAIYFD